MAKEEDGEAKKEGEGEGEGEAKKEEEEQPKGQPITSFVKQDMVNTLMEMGFTKNASEKALFMTMSSG